ncbi:MAG: acireductone synthase [Planctomycetales bacterium]|nr:acireductone synthase [Planctomycetales bacterium]
MTLPPRGILLDIEGTTSSISFVHDVMFPYVRQRLDAFLREHFDRPQVQAAAEQIAQDAGQVSLAAWQVASGGCSASELVQREVLRLMDGDVKATGLKALQGLIWERGFQDGKLSAHVYPDVLPAIEQWRAAGIDVRIFSSGSIAAQKLFFGHVQGVGNCLPLFSGHYDTTWGSKKESKSYVDIAQDWGLEPAHILFISDLAAELTAAQAAGLRALASVRPGNSSLPPELPVERIDSFAQVGLAASP